MSRPLPGARYRGDRGAHEYRHRPGPGRVPPGKAQIPDTLRFLRFPPTALIGRHQALNQEIDLDYCRKNDIGVVRRITGGGAIYHGARDNWAGNWSSIESHAWRQVSSLAGSGAVKSAQPAADQDWAAWALNASYRPRNDIEVGWA